MRSRVRLNLNPHLEVQMVVATSSFMNGMSGVSVLVLRIMPIRSLGGRKSMLSPLTSCFCLIPDSIPEIPTSPSDKGTFEKVLRIISVGCKFDKQSI